MIRFPYGIADFHSIRAEDYIYIDRTDRIALVEEAGKQLLLLRPRRFGKSLWLSTLENYYDLAKADCFEALFGSLKIGQNPTPLHNRYFVLKLNFSGVEPSGDIHEIRQAFHQNINNRIYAFSIYYQKYLPYSIKQEENSFSSFSNLLAVVSSTNNKLYLLIDEYDNFANTVMMNHGHSPQRYLELVAGEGIIKTFFKVVKEYAEGRGLDRVFITGVAPVVLSDITSGYNVIKAIAHRPEYNDLCGFTFSELQNILERVGDECNFTSERIQNAQDLMRVFYNGYRFSPRSNGGLIYNPTLVLYFLDALMRDCEYPEQMLDENLAMDRNRIRYVAALPHGQTLVTQVLAANETNPEQYIAIDQLADRFGVEAMLDAPRDYAFLASLLYYLGVLTLAGRNNLGQLLLTIPNLVVRRLYAERLQEALLPKYEEQEQRQRAAMLLYSNGDLAPLCDLIEQRYFKVFDNRDLRWSNELVVKTAFLTLLFNDTYYIVDSEQSIERGYADLTLILRPDTRRYQLFDHVFEFKQLRWKELGISSVEGQEMTRETLRDLPAVAEKLAEAEKQLARYRDTLEKIYGEKLKLRTHAVVSLGLERLIYRNYAVGGVTA